MNTIFEQRLHQLENAYNELITRENAKQLLGNGIYDRYAHPILTDQHAPLYWR